MRRESIHNYQGQSEGLQEPRDGIKADQVFQLYSQSQWGLLGALLSAFVLVVALWQVVSQARLLVWLSCYLCVQVVRYLLVASFHRSSPSAHDAATWGRWFALSTIASGLVWGSAGVFLFPVESISHQFLLALFLAGISSAAAVVYSATVECFLPTVLAELLPISALYFYQGDELGITIGSVILVFAVVLSLTGIHMHRTNADSLSLRFERSQLIESLEKARNDLEFRVEERTSELVRINRKLEGEIERRKEAEEDLRQSERKYRRIIENTNDLVYQGDMEGRLIFSSPSSVGLLGYTPEEALGRHLSEFYAAPEESDSFLKLLMAGDSVTDFEAELVRKDGSQVWVSTNARLIKDQAGNPIGVEGIARDVTVRKEAEQALRERERAWSTLISNLPGFVYRCANDRNWTMEYVSDGCREVTGYEPDDFIGNQTLTYNDIVAPDFREPLWRKWQDVLSRKAVFADEYPIIAKGGENRWVWERGQGIFAEDGRLLFLEGFITDITERKKMEIALRENQGKLQTIFEASPAGIILVGTDGRISFANRKMGDLFSRPFEDLLGTPYVDLVHPEQRSRGYAKMKALIAGEIDNVSLERCYLAADGREFFGHLSGRRIMREDGTLEGLIAIITDITDRKRSEEALFQAKHDWEDTFNSIEDMITIHDKDFNIMHYNTAAEKTLGLTNLVTADGIKCYQYYHGKDCPPEACPSCRCLQTREQAVSEVFEPHLNMFLEVRAIPRFDRSGQLTGLVHIVRDITARKKGEEDKARLEQQLLQAQKMESIGTLAGGVAHDFNNILQVVLGYTEMILDEEQLPVRYLADLRKIHESARRGADLVQRLLTFSRKTEIKPQPVNLNHRITEVRKMVERTIPKMIDIQLFLGEKIATINADPTQVDQLLMNLAVNARDAMPDGGRLTVETADIILDEEYAKTHLDADSGRYVLLMVTDTGAGMDKETLDHIFEPFYTTKAVGEGTGLGLAMVHGIVKQHGGHIRCFSEPGHGTTFKIYFPALTSDEEPLQIKVEPMLRGGEETICLVDDEAMIRDLGSRILTKAGYTVITASNGKEALDVYQRRKDEISLVILDLMMPVMGGKQCLDGLLRLNPDVKVVIASGFSVNGHTQDALSAGAKGFVHKPYDIRQVLEIVREVLDAE